MGSARERQHAILLRLRPREIDAQRRNAIDRDAVAN
jgi:hypothetical protein